MTELSNLCGLAQVRAVKKSCHAALVFSQSGREHETELISLNKNGAGGEGGYLGHTSCSMLKKM